MLAERSSHTQRQHRDVLAAARAGDAGAFRVLVEPHRAEIYSHCSRMFGSVHDADDAFQDAMLRAWRGLSGLLDGTRLRPWLYTIATNACVDAINARQKRARPIDCSTSTRSSDGSEAVDQSIWVEAHANPSPGGAGRHRTPEGRYEQRESVELAFLAALQHLPGRQRAVLILREVLGFSAREVAQLLQTTVPSVNSTLQRARRNVHERVTAPSPHLTMRAAPRRARPRPRRALHRRTRSRRCRHDPRHAHTAQDVRDSWRQLVDRDRYVIPSCSMTHLVGRCGARTHDLLLVSHHGSSAVLTGEIAVFEPSRDERKAHSYRLYRAAAPAMVPSVWRMSPPRRSARADRRVCVRRRRCSASAALGSYGVGSRLQ